MTPPGLHPWDEKPITTSPLAPRTPSLSCSRTLRLLALRPSSTRAGSRLESPTNPCALNTHRDQVQLAYISTFVSRISVLIAARDDSTYASVYNYGNPSLPRQERLLIWASPAHGLRPSASSHGSPGRPPPYRIQHLATRCNILFGRYNLSSWPVVRGQSL